MTGSPLTFRALCLLSILFSSGIVPCDAAEALGLRACTEQKAEQLAGASDDPQAQEDRCADCVACCARWMAPAVTTAEPPQPLPLRTPLLRLALCDRPTGSVWRPPTA